MALRNRKLVAQANPSCVDLCTVLHHVRGRYPGLIYLGIWYHEAKVCFYLQNKENMSALTLTGLLEKAHVDCVGISPYSTVEGELQEEWRSRPLRASKHIVVDADTKAIFVHSLGKESLQHITREFVVDLLKQMLNINVFLKFGLKLYALEQNINYRARKNYKYVRVRCDDGWITVSKEEAYDELLLLLVEKTQQAVNMFRDDIPAYYINHFDGYANCPLDYKKSSVPKFRKLYERRRNKWMDTIAVSVNDRLSRLSSWSGEKRTLI